MPRKALTLITLLLFAITLSTFAVLNKHDVNDSSSTRSPEPLLESNLPIVAVDEFSEFDSASMLEYTLKKNASEKAQSYTYNDIAPSYALEVPEVIQTPELPTGCESVALATLLMYMGYELDKTTIADDYLLYDTENMAIGYVGDPYSKDGAGCFPPVIIDTADAFLTDMDSDQRALNVSGSTLNTLFHYVANNLPVVIWTTMYMADVESTNAISKRDDTEYTWYLNEHCVLLCGYNLERNTVLINDPLEGIVERDLSSFEQIYNDIGQYAVIIP